MTEVSIQPLHDAAALLLQLPSENSAYLKKLLTSLSKDESLSEQARDELSAALDLLGTIKNVPAADLPTIFSNMGDCLGRAINCAEGNLSQHDHPRTPVQRSNGNGHSNGHSDPRKLIPLR